MTEYQKLVLQYVRLLGEFKGTLEAVTYWEIPEELKEKMRDKIKELERVDVPDINL